jgi:hypothetical protein
LRRSDFQGCIKGQSLLSACLELISKRQAFPYLADKTAITGGGDVPEITWHIIARDAPFDLCGITVTPFSVAHGFAYANGERTPFPCLAFLFAKDIIYVSDVSNWPEESYRRVEAALAPEGDAPARPPILIIDTLKLA